MKVDVADRFGCTPLYYAALAYRVQNVAVRLTSHDHQRLHDRPLTNPHANSLQPQVLMELFSNSKEQRANPLLRTRDADSPWLVAGQWSHLRDEWGRDQRALFELMQKRVVRVL